MSATEKFITHKGCMDGRIQEVVANFLEQQFGGKPDTITLPGIIKILHEGPEAHPHEWAMMNTARNISAEKHGSNILVISAHKKCAGNPVTDEEQIQQILDCISRFSTDPEFSGFTVYGVFVDEKDGEWTPRFVREAEATA